MKLIGSNKKKTIKKLKIVKMFLIWKLVKYYLFIATLLATLINMTHEFCIYLHKINHLEYY